MKLLYSEKDFLVVEYPPQKRTIIGGYSVKGRERLSLNFPYMQLAVYKGLLFAGMSATPLKSMEEKLKLPILPNVFWNHVVCLHYHGITRDAKTVIDTFWRSGFGEHESWPGSKVLDYLGYRSLRDYQKSSTNGLDPCNLPWPTTEELGDPKASAVDAYYFRKTKFGSKCLADIPKLWENDEGYKNFLSH